MFESMAPFLPPPPAGVGSPFQWGDESYCEQMLGDAFELSFTERNSPYVGDSGAEMWEVFRVNSLARRTRSGSRSTRTAVRSSTHR